MKQILDNYDKHMKMYGAGYTGQDLSYTTLPEHLIAAINARNKNLVDADTSAKDLEREREQVRHRRIGTCQESGGHAGDRPVGLGCEREKFNAERNQGSRTKARRSQPYSPQKNADLAKVTSAAAAKQEEMTPRD